MSLVVYVHLNLALTISRNCEGFPQFPQDFTFFSSCLRSLGGKSVSKYFPQLSQSLFLQNLLKGKHASFKLHSHTRPRHRRSCDGDDSQEKRLFYVILFVFSLFHFISYFNLVGVHKEKSFIFLLDTMLMYVHCMSITYTHSIHVLFLSIYRVFK